MGRNWEKVHIYHYYLTGCLVSICPCARNILIVLLSWKTHPLLIRLAVLGACAYWGYGVKKGADCGLRGYGMQIHHDLNGNTYLKPYFKNRLFLDSAQLSRNSRVTMSSCPPIYSLPYHQHLPLNWDIC